MAENEETEQKPLRVRFRIPVRMPSVIAHHLTVQPNEDGVIISFYEEIPPVITEDRTKEDLKIIEESGVIAECVSRVFVPNSKYVDFVDALDSVIPNDEEDEEDK